MRHGEEDGLAGFGRFGASRALPFQRRIEVELPAVDVHQPLALDAALAGEVEEHQAEGGERPSSATLGGREQHQGRRPALERFPYDPGHQRLRDLGVAGSLGRQQVIDDPAVAALGKGVGAPQRVVGRAVVGGHSGAALDARGARAAVGGHGRQGRGRGAARPGARARVTEVDPGEPPRG